MKIYLHGQLKDQFGSEFEIQTDLIADAVEGLSSQFPDWPRNLLISVVKGEETADLYGTATEIDLIPAMFGGGGKFGTILLGAALIAASFVIPGSGAAIAAIRSALLINGAIMAATGVVSIFFKSPTLSKSEDPEASKYFGININTTKSGTPVTLAWGRVPLHGQWLSLQSDSDKLSFGTFPATPT